MVQSINYESREKSLLTLKSLNKLHDVYDSIKLAECGRRSKESASSLKAACIHENSRKLSATNDSIVLEDGASAQPAKRIISQLIRPFINTVQS